MGDEARDNHEQQIERAEIANLVRSRMDSLNLPAVDYNDVSEKRNSLSYVIINPSCELIARHRRYPSQAIELSSPRANCPSQEQSRGCRPIALLHQLQQSDQDCAKRQHWAGGYTTRGVQLAPDVQQHGVMR